MGEVGVAMCPKPFPVGLEPVFPRLCYMGWWRFHWEGFKDRTVYASFDANPEDIGEVPGAICPAICPTQLLGSFMATCSYDWHERKKCACLEHSLKWAFRFVWECSVFPGTVPNVPNVQLAKRTFIMKLLRVQEALNSDTFGFLHIQVCWPDVLRHSSSQVKAHLDSEEHRANGGTAHSETKENLDHRWQ